MQGDNALSRRRLQPMNTALRRRQMSVPYYYLAESSHAGQIFPRRPRLVLVLDWVSGLDYEDEDDSVAAAPLRAPGWFREPVYMVRLSP